jgi:hypothetical protein
MIKLPRATQVWYPAIDAIFDLQMKDRATITIVGNQAIIEFTDPEDEIELRLRYDYSIFMI